MKFRDPRIRHPSETADREKREKRGAKKQRRHCLRIAETIVLDPTQNSDHRGAPREGLLHRDVSAGIMEGANFDWQMPV